MDKIFNRNFLIFGALLVIAAAITSYSLIQGERQMSAGDNLIFHTHEIILEAEQLASHIEGLVSGQRAYIMTGDESFQKEYDKRKADISQALARLTELTQNNPAQQSRLDEMRKHYVNFSQALDERANSVLQTQNREILRDVTLINQLKENILRINNDVMEEEYGLLNRRFDEVNKQKSKYFKSLLVGVVFGSIILLILNAFLLRAQHKRSYAEKSLRGTEERLMLALEGTQDGIYDWDITNDKIFYSKQFFHMLGMNKEAYTGRVEDVKELIHPDDQERVFNYVDQYINGELSEYVQEFRMKHASGRWIWVQSSAKGIFNDEGKAIRLVGAHSDITASVKAQEKLEVEKEEAEEANRAKSDFLAHMSHEIRTPLTAISGIAEILQKKQDNLNDKQIQLVKTLNSSTSSLKELINDILDFSKIENGEIEFDDHNFNLNEVFEETISMMSLKASEKGISFIFDYKPVKDKEFYGDSKRIRQILINLIGNAIKFTDEGGVTIMADYEDRDGVDFLRIDVADTGIGIASENFDMVFERFKQADSSVSRKYGGTGLGLPISKNLARLMGGDIFVSSQVGKGSTFSVLLPAKITSENTDTQNEPRLDTQKINERIRSHLNQEDKILVVEDYEGNIVVLSYILDDIGIEYDVANNGEEALELWKTKHYDIILMDVQMPKMDGFTATKKIRENEQEKNLDRTPIIGMTAHALVGDKDKCIKAGMDSYLPKPLVEADIKKEILKYLRQKKKAA